MALAWVLTNSDVSVALVGASKLSQMENNIKALEFAKKWNLEIEQEIEDILDNKPQ